MANETNFIVSSLPDYVANNRELISKQIAFGTPTVKRVTPMTNVKYKAKLNFLGVSAPFQNGRGCAVGYDGTATFTDRDIETAILEQKIKICPDTLLGKWPEYEVRIPADKREYLPFEAYVISELIADCNDRLETLVWQGKTSAHGGSDLIDGYLYYAGADATVVDVTVNNGTSAFNAIRQIIAAAPAKLLKNLKVFVDPAFFQKLAFELVDANLYHFNPGEPIESLVFPGTLVEVYNTPGLAGSNKAYASVLKNMYYGTDEEGANKRVKVGYNEENGYFWMDIRFNAGVQHAFGDWVVLAALGTITSPDANAELKSIATSAATIATKQTSIETSAAALANADHVFKTKEQE